MTLICLSTFDIVLVGIALSLAGGILVAIGKKRRRVSQLAQGTAEADAGPIVEDSRPGSIIAAPKPRVRVLRGGWIRHVPGPFPFHLGAVVETIHADGLVVQGREAERAGFWHESWWKGEADSWRRNIVFYRIVRCPGHVSWTALPA